MTRKNIIVLGAGMVGSAMAIDLSANHHVTLSDVSEQALTRAKSKCPDIRIIPLDVKDTDKLRTTIEPFDLVICAVPGFLGFETIRQIILAGKNLVDISFFPENCLDLDALAREKGVTAIVDCGVAPGMGNLILGRYNELLKLTRFECLVGGLPKARKWPFSYQAPFSPIDVIEEYTRPARYVENGALVTRDPLTDCEYVEFDQVGTLEAFNSDGLRSILFTMPHIPNMKEKTMRYPGHVEYIKVLKESGFFSKDPLLIQGRKVVPLEMTCQILFNDWKLGDTDPEITVMRITLEGTDPQGKVQKVVFNLHDEYDPVTKTSSMARTTGYTATAAANMMIEGLFKEKGVFPPELVGKHENCYRYMLAYLERRNIRYIQS